MTIDSAKNTQRQRSKRIELIIVPGKSLGPFRLGSSLWDVIYFLRDRPQFFPTVELKYSQEDPLFYDFIIALPSNGLNLRFDGALQRLKSMECYDPSKVKLVYQNSDVSSSRTIPTFLLVYKSFGPTYPGEFDPLKGLYILKYPGVSFMFPIPTRYQDLYAKSSELPLEFPDGTTAIASHIYLYSGGNSWQKATVPVLSKVVAEQNSSTSVKYGKPGRREVENIIAQPTQGVTLHFPNYNSFHETNKPNENILATSVNHVSIILHRSSAQDILAELGKPSRIFYKEEDKMKIHSIMDERSMLGKSPNKDERQDYVHTVNLEDEDKDSTSAHPTDYFLNYFHLGIDILMDGALHVCKKIILHGNIPGHYDFQRYKRCRFQLEFKHEDAAEKDPNLLVDVDTALDDDQFLHVVADMKISDMRKHIPWKPSSTVTVTPNESQATQHKPVILTRGSSEQNPFGATYLTGYDEGLVIEVMKNGCIPTMILF
ncbi:uncharacterized protein BYT42DRAFT_583999 [Radiomyces spectabilis]|uniref:uncharacterized protein n=1 Tax=Radiomyces spectabilis TaxID=64574 RepID=UPI00221F3CC6|nr:uncharacterized protein BYT42DRAFT_583999 [Radiomyces spectabilis]KAI8369334.1 hypothetical protein BYT42DRAFT_583999 [Radiomyces spectabilis]